MHPEISIIIPIYNCSLQLDRCLQSIINQTFQKFEVIMVNDGSTDDTEEICNKYSFLDSRFKYYKQSNKGKSIAVNLGYSKAKGKYVAFYDSDDYIKKNLLKIAYEAITKYKVDILNYNYLYIKDNYENKKTTLFPKNRVLNSREIRNIFKSNNSAHHPILWFTWTNLIRKDILDQNNILHATNQKIGVDVTFNLQCYLSAQNIYSINDHLYYYIYYPTSTSQKKYKPNLLKEFQNQFNHRKEIHKKHLLNDTVFNKNIAIYYIEHSLLFLINNEKNSKNKLQPKRLKKIRESEIYKFCFKFYQEFSKELTMKQKVTIFLFKNYHLKSLCYIHNIFSEKRINFNIKKLN